MRVPGGRTILALISTSVELQEAERTLRADGWDVLGTTDPWEAMTLLSRHPVNLILLDSGNGGPDGSVFCSLLDDDPALNGIPIVYCTEDGGQASSPRNCRTTLLKPVTADALQSAVREHLLLPFPRSGSEDSGKATRFIHRRRNPLHCQTA